MIAAQVVPTVKAGVKSATNPDGGGRPSKLKSVDLNVVRKLGVLACTHAEIACFLGIREASIDSAMQPDAASGAITRFAAAYKKGLEATRQSLRRKQLQIALSGNVTMLIWLGKQLLSQRDFMEVDNKTRVDVNVTKHVRIALFESSPTRAPSTTPQPSPASPQGTDADGYERVVGHNGNGNGTGHDGGGH